MSSATGGIRIVAPAQQTASVVGTTAHLGTNPSEGKVAISQKIPPTATHNTSWRSTPELSKLVLAVAPIASKTKGIVLAALVAARSTTRRASAKTPRLTRIAAVVTTPAYAGSVTPRSARAATAGGFNWSGMQEGSSQ